MKPTSFQANLAERVLQVEGVVDVRLIHGVFEERAADERAVLVLDKEISPQLGEEEDQEVEEPEHVARHFGVNHGNAEAGRVREKGAEHDGPDCAEGVEGVEEQF